MTAETGQMFGGAPLLSGPANSGGAALNQALLQLVARIESVLEEESEALSRSVPEEFERLVARKNHLALEIARLGQHAKDFVPEESLRKRLVSVGQKLAHNSQLLRRHIDTVGEIAALIAETISNATSDGTYSSSIGRPGRNQ